MSGTVFDSYIKSVYGSGSSMEFFDNISGGAQDIFGGLDPMEIFDEPSSLKSSLDTETKKDTKHHSNDLSDHSGREGSDDDQSIIGYIQIGIHMTPIVDDNQDDITAPMKIQLHPTKTTKDKKISPEDIGDALSAFD